MVLNGARELSNDSSLIKIDNTVRCRWYLFPMEYRKLRSRGHIMKKSIKIRMLFIFSGLILISGILTSVIAFNVSNQLITDSIGRQALGIAAQGREIIDLEKYQELSIETGETNYYYELRNELNKIRETNGLVYLYTMQRKESGDGYDYYYMVDGMPEGAEDASQIGDKEEDVQEYPKLVETFETGEKQLGEMSVSEEYGALLSTYVPIKSASGEVIGIIGADFDATEIHNLMKSSKNKLILITLAVLLVSIIIIYFTTLRLTKPLQTLSAHVELIGKGNMSSQLESKSEDEVGKLTNSFNQMQLDLKSMIEEINRNSLELNDAATDLLVGADETNSASKQIALTLEHISGNAISQHKSLEESVQVIEEMAMGVNQISQSSSNASELSSKTLEEVETGNQKIDKLIKQMNTISGSVNQSSASIMTMKDHSNEIENIVNIIQQISSQTNLLALNAAIEAARAGEAGRGFAVVAGEVRKLAEQTESATGNIKELIEKINHDTNQTVSNMEIVLSDVKDGMNAVSETGEVFKNIIVAIEGVNHQIQEVSATSEEMSASTEEITASAIETAKIAEQAAASTKDTVNITYEQNELIANITQSIRKLTIMSEQMKALTARFKL